MSDAKAEDVMKVILMGLEPMLETAGIAPADLDPDLDLLAAGVLDSFSVLDLLTFIEERLEVKADLGDMDFTKAMTVRGLAEEILRTNPDWR